MMAANRKMLEMTNCLDCGVEFYFYPALDGTPAKLCLHCITPYAATIQERSWWDRPWIIGLIWAGIWVGSFITLCLCGIGIAVAFTTIMGLS